MEYRYSLAFLTAPELSPPNAVRVAAQAGYDHVGLRLLPSGNDGPYPILNDAALQRETRRAIKNTGVTVADIEIISIKPDFDPQATRPFLECGASLGARNILVAGYDPEPDRMTQSYGAFCELAHSYGLTADLEFMPWTHIPNVTAAADQIRAVNHQAAGLLVDALHVQKSHSPFEDIAALDPAWIHYAQLCDGPNAFDSDPDALIAAARGNRMMPGDGDFDFIKLLGSLPKGIILSLEIPQSERLNTDSALVRATEAITKAKRITAGD